MALLLALGVNGHHVERLLWRIIEKLLVKLVVVCHELIEFGPVKSAQILLLAQTDAVNGLHDKV